MTLQDKAIANWLVAGGILLALLVIGRPLLAPFAIALLVWAVLNAIVDGLKRLKLPPPLAWAAALLLILAGMYLVARILSDEGASLADKMPGYLAKLQSFAAPYLGMLKLGKDIDIPSLIGATGAPGVVASALTSFTGVLIDLTLIAIYVGVLLAEQRHLPAKLAQLVRNPKSKKEAEEILEAVASQVQSYLGVCTLLSAAMAGATYLTLRLMGVDFAGFWALVMFLVTYIPTVGAIAAVLPAVMVLLQFGSLPQALLVFVILSAVHFVLTNIVQTVMLGRSLDLSPLAIFLSLSFWGLIWGIPGLFLAVPLMGAIALICSHIDELRWVEVVVAGRKRTPHKPKAKTEEAAA